MRSKLFCLAAAMVVLFSSAAYGQATLAKPTDPNAQSAAALDGRPYGAIDFGGRFSDINGDKSRFRRYRDLRDGGTLDRAFFSRRGQDWTLDVLGTNVGYRDQQFRANYNLVGKVKASFVWDQVPMFLSDSTRTPYTQTEPGVFRLPDSIQLANELRTTTTRDYLTTLRDIETRTRRNNGAINFSYMATRDLDVNVNVITTTRTGSMHYMAPFGFSNAVELPVPLDQRTTDSKMEVEWATRTAMASVGWNGSWFDNKIQTLIWDNPLKLNDSPAYSSAYSDGRGAAQGRMALWPNNTLQYVHGTGSITTPGRGRIVAYAALGSARQNADLLPHTINSLIPNIPLERPTAEAELRNTIFNFQYTMRPVRLFYLNARYRYVDVDNRTPHFETLGRVRFDGVYDDAANSPEPEPYSVKRKNFDIDASFNVAPYTAVRVGYGNAISDRTFRIFEETVEDTVRVSVDTTGNRYLSVRGVFENANRRGDQVDEHLLAEFGEQPGMRHYDVAARDRKRFTLMANLTPNDVIGFNLSAGVGREDYPESEFGLKDYESNQYSVGFDLVPSDRIGFALAYGWENYDSITGSRTANPPTATDQTFYDARRNWFMDYTGSVKNIDATLDLVDIAPNTDLRAGMSWNDLTDTYRYRLAEVTTLATPTQLRPVLNELLSGTLEVTYRFTNRVRMGVGYWYETYKVDDFSLDGTAMKDVVLPIAPTAPNTLLLGYTYRPYTANTGYVRLTYLW